MQSLGFIRSLLLVAAASLALPAGAQMVLSDVSVGANPAAVAINPNTHKVYVANNGSDDVTVIESPRVE